LNIWDVPRVLILLVARPLRFGRLSMAGCAMLGRVLEVVSDVLLIDGVRDLCRVAKEVEISSYRTLAGAAFSPATKCIIVQVVASLLKLIAQAIIGVFEVDAERSCLA
jgi:hypothetical protein